MELSMVFNKNLIICVISILGIIFSLNSIRVYFSSKAYKLNRLLSAIYYNEDTKRFIKNKDFCLEKKLIFINDNHDLELTDRGFTFMINNASQFISYIALMISIISFFLSFSNCNVK